MSASTEIFQVNKTCLNELVCGFNNLISVFYPLFIVYSNKCIENIVSTFNVYVGQRKIDDR